MRGNAKEPGDARRSPGSSFLLLLTVYYPGIRLSGDRVKRQELSIILGASGALLIVLENPGDVFIRQLVRTTNRIRSPR